ncbi:hypothetical protein LRS03_00460 [Rhizobacter sp. J219]|uniref:hypothetical protein n=1 Tax=Rhizobacter sp. J219 TaxID=2898430 RepID=UPI0021510ADA|nr:hypothetical protein [Rhizobacter sp. J219]MCR5881415.1 hypothetical protein [Rhizobacter sp. J219]
MWRLKQSSSREVLRLGRLAAERWKEVPGGLTCVAAHPLTPDAADRFAPLPHAIESLFAQAGDARVTVVLESAWVPLMLAETGRAIWHRSEVEALLRHRFAALHDELTDPVGEWDVRVDHRPGDQWALGYGFSSRLRMALDEASRLSGREWVACLPAWSWGWQRVQPQRQWAKNAGHWVWQEQDRMLLGSFVAGRPVALNPAGRWSHDAESLGSELRVHSVRCGLQSADWHAVVAGWHAASELPASAGHLTWAGLGGQGAKARVAA